MSDMETEPLDGTPIHRIMFDYRGMSSLQLLDAMELHDRNQERDRKTTQGNDKRRKQKSQKRKPLSLLQKKLTMTNAVTTRRFKNLSR
ncbi:hypothetical protein TNCV_4755831 [Trichonephila clavipes]|nr:hypothetical protein TNCV_4755831 [Trichonephila clavipes]